MARNWRNMTEADLTRTLRHTDTHLVDKPLLACRIACTLILPWPPSINHYWCPVGSRFVLSAAAKDYRRALATAVQQQRRGQPPYRERLHLELDLHGPYSTPDAYDLDNFSAKGVLDALTHAGLWEDDKHVYCMRPRKGAPSIPGYVVLLIDLCRHRHCCAVLPPALKQPT